MAKKAKVVTSTGISSKPTGQLGAASIDDIFAKPSKTAKLPIPITINSTPSSSKSKKAIASSIPIPSTSNVSSSSTTSQPIIESGEPRKKKKKRVHTSDVGSAEDAVDKGVTGKEQSTRVVETFVDPSTIARAFREADDGSKGKKPVTKKRDRKDNEDDEAFRDSRGEGPRRKTEEGFLIYKEAELGINPEAGGTPLCPFDCDCCF